MRNGRHSYAKQYWREDTQKIFHNNDGDNFNDDVYHEGNVLQIAAIAILLSACIIILGEKVAALKRVIGDGKVLMFKIMEVVLKLLPRLALKYKISVKDFLRKISPVLVIAFVTMSSSASMAKNFEVCKHSLKLNEKLCDLWIPMSHSLLAPGTVVTLVAYAFFAAEFNDSRRVYRLRVVVNFWNAYAGLRNLRHLARN